MDHPNLLELDSYDRLWYQAESCNNISHDSIHFLSKLLDDSYQQNIYNEPMIWIGMYICLASLFCIIAMMCDLIHGFRNKKLWFPCKYFTPNAASLTIIAVAMKLLVDLNNSMRGHVDQMAKVGSMSFMCIIMANILPSLATMDNKVIVSNIIALGVLIITLVVNVCIQISTGVFCSHFENYYCVGLVVYDHHISTYLHANRNSLIAIIYAAMLLMLMLIHTCSAFAILESKHMLETKYKAAHEKALKDIQPAGRRLTAQKLKQHVRNYWIMAGTGSPEFMTVCSPTTSAAGVICATSCLIHIILIVFTVSHLLHYDSDYKWSTPVILLIQFFGVILGTIAPIFRCFATLSFKVSIKRIRNSIKVFTVETHWTHKLNYLKNSSLPSPFRSRKCKVVIEKLKSLMLEVCIGLQKAVVVTCKMIALIPNLCVICVLFCISCWKWLIKAIFSESGNIIVLGKTTQRPEQDNDLGRYVLQLQDEMEFAERTVKDISKFVNRLIEKSEKRKPKNLMKLLAESRGFEGVEKFDSHHIPSLLPEENLNCWSLPLVTLTTIANSLPKIQRSIVEDLLSSVNEGFAYVKLVEESLNAADGHVSIQKAAENLWHEVEVDKKWLGNKLTNPDLSLNTAEQILVRFWDTAKKVINEGSNENLFRNSICANSMYRITETIIRSNQDIIKEDNQEELFVKLSSMISDILSACLTNLPQVIAMKCHECVIEKREASVQAAARLLGETTIIINILQARELPSLNPDELPFIDKWRASLRRHPSP